MKWNNKGHEFDGVYAEIEKKCGFYLFGAGDYGQQFFNIMKDEIEIQGFIDNDVKKKEAVICGQKVYTFDDIDLQNCRYGIV